jgi:hypothetical protein
LALQPLRQPFFEARRAENVRVAEFDETRTFGMFGHCTLDGNSAQLIGLAFGGSHIVPENLEISLEANEVDPALQP